MTESDLLLAVISFFATVISILLIVVGFFFKRIISEITEARQSITMLNTTMTVYITKHDTIEKIVDGDIQNLKEFRNFVYIEIEKIREHIHKQGG